MILPLSLLPPYPYRPFLALLTTGVEDIVAIMIPEPKGKEIVSLLERNITVTMYITIGTRNLQKYVSRTSVVFVSISFIVLMIISLAWLVFYYIQRFRYANARDRNQVSSKKLKKKKKLKNYYKSKICYCINFGNQRKYQGKTKTTYCTQLKINTVNICCIAFQIFSKYTYFDVFLVLFCEMEVI